MFKNRKKTIKGLPLLISSKYFDEAFVLHDQTSHENFTKIIDDFKFEQISEFNKGATSYFEEIIKQFSMTDHEDPRSFLQDNWASLKCIFKYQPLHEIRNYYGEQNAIYFAYAESFATSLILPSVVGLVFFVLGITFYYS